MIIITGIAENELFTCPGTAAVGDAVYISASKTVAFADVDDRAKFAHGIIWLMVTSTTCKIRFGAGIIHTSGLTAATDYYLTGTATSGNTLSVTPSAQRIGIAISTTELLFLGFQAFSTDGTLAGNSDIDVPTEAALVTAFNNAERANFVMDINVGNGASIEGLNSHSIIRLPGSDNDCFFSLSIRIPEHVDDGNITINFLYVMNNTGAYEGVWNIDSNDRPAGDLTSTTDQNILSADGTHDFPTGTAATWYIHTITIATDADLHAGDLIGIQFASDASNTPRLDIAEIWLT